MEHLAITMYEYGMLGKDDVVLTQAWLNDLSAAGYTPPSKPHPTAETQNEKHGVKGVTEVRRLSAVRRFGGCQRLNYKNYRQRSARNHPTSCLL